MVLNTQKDFINHMIKKTEEIKNSSLNEEDSLRSLVSSLQDEIRKLVEWRPMKEITTLPVNFIGLPHPEISDYPGLCSHAEGSESERMFWFFHVDGRRQKLFESEILGWLPLPKR